MCGFVDKYVVWIVVVVIGNVGCNPVTNNFNSSVKDLAVTDDNANSTSVQTLQKQEIARYANLAPVRSPIKFKEISDNDLSSSAHYGRGLLHHEHNGYGLLDYDDNQHYGHGVDYHLQGTGHDLAGHHHVDHGLHGHHGYGLGHIGHGVHDHHHDALHGHHETHVYHGDGHLDHGHGHHHKHLAHALAAKTIFWPIAGIALLGAAAALVSNPVLLQLGVVSGRRKRETKETTDFDKNSLRKWMTMNPFEVITKTQADTDKNIAHISSLKVLRPIDNYDKINEQENVSNNVRHKVNDNKDDILKRQRMSRLLNTNKRTFRKPSENPSYVSQSDLPRTESNEDKHYIAVPLFTNN